MKKKLSGWAIRHGVAIPGARPRQRVRVVEADDEIAEISFVDGSGERVVEIVPRSDLERVPLPGEYDRDRGLRRSTRGPWSALELGAAVALVRAGVYPARARDVLERIFVGGARTAQAVAKSASSLTGIGSTAFSREIAAAVAGPTAVDVHRPGVAVLLGRIPGIAGVAGELVENGANAADLEGDPNPDLPRASTAPTAWSQRELALALALSTSGASNVEVSAELERLTGTPRSSDAVWATLDKLLDRKARTRTQRKLLARAGVGSRKPIPDDLDLGRILSPEDLAEVVASTEVPTEPVGNGSVERETSTAVATLAEVRRIVGDSFAIVELATALQRALTRACAGETAVANSHLAAELGGTNLPGDPTAALALLRRP